MPPDINELILSTIQGIFPGAEIVPPDAKPTGVAISAFHQINAPCWGVLAPGLVERGWSSFPQTRDGRRGPGIVDGAALKWGEYQKRRPTQAEVAWWTAFCRSHNVAGILGDASGGTFALDIDVDDEDLSVQIVETADRSSATPRSAGSAAPRASCSSTGRPSRPRPAPTT